MVRVEDQADEANHRKAIRLVAKAPALIANFDRHRNGESFVEPDPSLGIAMGFGLSYVLNRVAGWEGIITGSSVALAFSISVGVGIISGIYPAIRASRLDPVRALRYE